jgi:hypothetical protein
MISYESLACSVRNQAHCMSVCTSSALLLLCQFLLSTFRLPSCWNVFQNFRLLTLLILFSQSTLSKLYFIFPKYMDVHVCSLIWLQITIVAYTYSSHHTSRTNVLQDSVNRILITYIPDNNISTPFHLLLDSSGCLRRESSTKILLLLLLLLRLLCTD